MIDRHLELTREQLPAFQHRLQILHSENARMAGVTGPSHEAQRVIDQLVPISEVGAEQDALKEQLVGGKCVLVISAVVGVLGEKGEDVVSGRATQIPPLRPPEGTYVRGKAPGRLQAAPQPQHLVQEPSPAVEETRILSPRDAGLPPPTHRVRVKIRAIATIEAPARI